MIGKLKLSSSGNGEVLQPVKSPVSNPAFTPMASAGTTSVVVSLHVVRRSPIQSQAYTHREFTVVIVGGAVMVALALVDCEFTAFKGSNGEHTRTKRQMSC